MCPVPFEKPFPIEESCQFEPEYSESVVGVYVPGVDEVEFVILVRGLRGGLRWLIVASDPRKKKAKKQCYAGLCYVVVET